MLPQNSEMSRTAGLVIEVIWFTFCPGLTHFYRMFAMKIVKHLPQMWSINFEVHYHNFDMSRF